MLSPQYAGEKIEELAPVFSFVVGTTLLLMGILRFGFLDNIMSRPLLSGFVNAVAVIIFISQLESFFGLPPAHKEQAWEKLYAVILNIPKLHLLTTLLGVACLSLLITVRVLKWRFSEFKWPKFIIDTMLVVVIGVTFSYFFNLQELGMNKSLILIFTFLFTCFS